MGEKVEKDASLKSPKAPLNLRRPKVKLRSPKAKMELPRSRRKTNPKEVQREVIKVAAHSLAMIHPLVLLSFRALTPKGYSGRRRLRNDSAGSETIALPHVSLD